MIEKGGDGEGGGGSIIKIFWSIEINDLDDLDDLLI